MVTGVQTCALPISARAADAAARAADTASYAADVVDAADAAYIVRKHYPKPPKIGAKP
jgi:hypothetical protein